MGENTIDNIEEALKIEHTMIVPGNFKNMASKKLYSLNAPQRFLAMITQVMFPAQ